MYKYIFNNIVIFHNKFNTLSIYRICNKTELENLIVCGCVDEFYYF